MFADVISAVAGGIGSIGDIAIGASNLDYNKNQNNFQKNWAFADSRAAQSLLNYYIKNGTLSGYTPGINQDYDDVANYLTPYLSLQGLNLQQNAQKLSEDQFKYSKYVTENSAQIKAKDYEKAGFSPLLAVGGSSSYSPVSVASAGSSPYSSNRPNLQQLSTNMSISKMINDLSLTQAQIKNINADTALKNNQAVTESYRPDEISAGIRKTNADIKQINNNADLLAEKLKTQGYTTMLTQNQIEYVAQQIATLSWDYEMSVNYGTKSFEQLPLMLKEVQQVVNAIGVDVNSEMGQKLSTFLFIGLALAGAKVNSGKPKIKKTQTYENRGGKITERITKESYE